MSALVLSESLCRSGIAVPGVPQQQRLSPVHVKAGKGASACTPGTGGQGHPGAVQQSCSGGQGVSFVADEGMVLLFWRKEV